MPRFALSAIALALAFALQPAAAETAAAEPVQLAAPAATAWWHTLGEPALAGLVEQALRDNHDIAQAVARIEQSRALLAGADAARLPGGGAAVGKTAPQAAQAVAEISWELDLFGRLKAHAGAAAQRLHASEAQADAVRLAVAAEVAHAYFALLGAREQLQLAREILAGRERTLQLVASRARAGLAAPIDDVRAKSDVEAAAADIPLHEAAARVALHRLAVLSGRSPAGFDVPSAAPAPLRFVALDLGDIGARIARRPDLREHEALLKARALDVDTVRAELLPRFSFTGVLGFVAGSFARLGTGGVSWLGAPSLMVPLLDRPRIEARAAAAGGQHREALAAYGQRTLLAAEEVENALARYAAGERSFNALQRRGGHAVEAERLARVRYQAGAADLLELLDAQRGAQQAQAQLAQAAMQQRQNLVAVLKAVGA